LTAQHPGDVVAEQYCVPIRNDTGEMHQKALNIDLLANRPQMHHSAT